MLMIPKDSNSNERKLILSVLIVLFSIYTLNKRIKKEHLSQVLLYFVYTDFFYNRMR